MDQLVCPEPNCGRRFTRRFTLNRHYQNVHCVDNIVEKCFLCGQIFSNCNELQKHYKRFHKPSKQFYVKESAFKRAFITYRYNFVESDLSFASSQIGIKDLLMERILLEAAQKNVCKVSLIFIAEMVMLDHSGEKLTSASIPFRSPSFLAATSSKRSITKNIIRSFGHQSQAMEDFMRNGSNWVFQRALAFDIEVATVRPLKGGDSSEMNDKITLKKFQNRLFLYNPSNKDQKCFLYCIAHSLFSKKIPKNDKRTDELKYKKFVKKFDISGLSFPISIKGIKKFLKKNSRLNLKVNILYRDSDDKVFPLEYGLGCGTKIVNLLMVQTKNSHHFILITDPNKYLRTNYKRENGKTSYKKELFCLHCLSSFRNPEKLEKHQSICTLNKAKEETVPQKGEKDQIVRFKNLERQHKLDYTAYLDFECVLPEQKNFCDVCQRLKCKCDASFTEVISHQLPIAYSFVVLGPNKKIIHEHSFSGENAAENLIEHLLTQENKWIRNLLSTTLPMKMTDEDKDDYENSTQCYLCDKFFSSKVIKCRDHNHYSGKFIGAACQQCNLRRVKPQKLRIFMHNGSKYDLHFIVKGISKFGEQISNLNVLPYNGENFRTLSFNCFEFVDSLAFLQASLAQLSADLQSSNHDYKILKQTSLVQTDFQFDASKLEMILKKSFFPYEYCKSLSQMYSIKKLPRRRHFYSNLSEKSISKKDHEFAKTVWKKFGCKNLVDYTLIYCKIDVMILSEIFEAFRDEMLKFSGLDPAQYISLPAYSYDSMLKITKSKIELPTDIDIVQFLESAKRGGMSVIGTRHLKPSTKRGSESEIVYIDANVIQYFYFYDF
jgi:hypothetical protein